MKFNKPLKDNSVMYSSNRTYRPDIYTNVRVLRDTTKDTQLHYHSLIKTVKNCRQEITQIRLYTASSTSNIQTDIICQWWLMKN
jgi:hypothetical protein